MQIGGQFILELLLALGTLAVAALLLWGQRLFGSSTGQVGRGLVNSLATKTRQWVIGLIVIRDVGFFLHWIFMLTALANAQGVVWGVGAWLYLFAMLAVLAGGVLELLSRK